MKTTLSQNKNENNLFNLLSKLKDFRRAQGRKLSLAMVLLIVIMSIMSGYFGQRSMGDFVKRNKRELSKIFKKPQKKLPSYQTIARILSNISFDELNKIFSQWAMNYVNITEKEWFSLDGKAICGTVINPNNKHQQFINLVSVFSNKRKQVIAVGKVGEDKKSEIPVVQDLIKMLDLEGVIFTIDALHCQKETTKIITESKNDYVIGVKGNQPKLYKQIKKTAKNRKLSTKA